MTATREEIAAAAMATSDRLNAEDLVAGPMTITIKDVRVIQGEKGASKLILDIHEHEHPWHTCKSVTRTILAMWPDEPSDWIGRQMVLYRDPTVVFKNDPLGGIRIQAASNLASEFTIKLTEHQKKRITRTVKPLKAAETKQPSVADRVAKAIKAYESCTDQAAFEKIDGLMENLYSVCDEKQEAELLKARSMSADRLAGGES